MYLQNFQLVTVFVKTVKQFIILRIVGCGVEEEEIFSSVTGDCTIQSGVGKPLYLPEEYLQHIGVCQRLLWQ